MKKTMLGIIVIGFVYIFSTSFFINLIPPNEKEVAGNYNSVYQNKQYRLVILSNSESKLTVKSNNLIVYEDKCKSWKIDKMGYSTFPIYNLSFSKCNKMDFNALLTRNIYFEIMIGNSGTEMKRIDPDANIFFRKKSYRGQLPP